MRKLTISVASSRFASDMRRHEKSWDAIIARLAKPKRGDEDLATYLSWSRDEQLAAKDVGYYIIGTFRDNRRKNDHFETRSAVVLDIDYPGRDFARRLEHAYGAYDYFWHTSRRHQVDEPRIRVILPLARDVSSADEYEAMTRLLGSWYDIEVVDGISHVAAQMMFLPSVCADGEFRHGHNAGPWVNPDELLSRHYIDWQDREEWPRRGDEIPPETRALRVEDPLQKPGIIGAWCRAYSIYDVLTDHIAGVYEPTDDEDRWRFGGGAGGAGALVYDEGRHLYSHHTGHDPAAGRSMNAWDLVRVHKFGERDRGVPKDTRPTKMPSFEAMTRLAAADKAVVAEMDTTEAFDDLSDDDDDGAAHETRSSAHENAGSASELTDSAPDLPDDEPDELDALIDALPAKGPSRADIRAELRDAIDDCDDPDDLTDSLLPQIAASGLPPTDTKDLLSRIDDRRVDLGAKKLGPQALRQGLKVAQEQIKGAAETAQIVDLETALMKRVLREQFDGGRTAIFMAKMWWHYQNGYWETTEDSVIQKRVMQTLLALKSRGGREGAAVDRLLAALQESGREDRLGALIEATTKLLSLELSRPSKSDPLGLNRTLVPSIMNCDNGELWFDRKTGECELRPHSPDSLLTGRIRTTYDPNAQCPTWDAALARVFADALEPDEQIRHFHELMGYTLQPTRDIAVWLLLKGPGGNGKSFLMSVISTLLGPSCMHKSVAELGKRDQHFEHGLFGKNLFLDDDYKKGALLPDDWLKKLSEMKPLSANPKFGDTYLLINRAIVSILSNSWPHTRDLSEGLRRRAMVFEMPRSLPENERDPRHMHTILEQELPGVLNRLVAGWQRVIRRGYRFDVPGECNAAKNEWLSSANPVARYVQTRLTPVDPKARTPAKDIFNDYMAWASLGGESAKPLGRNSFMDTLRDLGIAMIRVDNTWHVIGYKPVFGEDDDLF